MNDVQDKHNRQAILVEAEKLVERVEQAYRPGEAVHELERGLFRQRLRLALELKTINLKRYEHGARLLDDLGRQVGGWLRARGADHAADRPSVG